MTNEEIATGIAVLGKLQQAVFLRERLVREVMTVYGSSIELGALSYREGRRSLAADILKLLDLDLDNDRPDASSTNSGRSTSSGTRTSGDAGGAARRVPVEPPDGYGRGFSNAASPTRKPRKQT